MTPSIHTPAILQSTAPMIEPHLWRAAACERLTIRCHNLRNRSQVRDQRIAVLFSSHPIHVSTFSLGNDLEHESVAVPVFGWPTVAPTSLKSIVFALSAGSTGSAAENA